MAKITIHLSPGTLSSLPGGSRCWSALEQVRSTVEWKMQADWPGYNVAVDFQGRSDSGKTEIEVSGVRSRWEKEELRLNVSYHLPMKLDAAIERVDFDALDVVGEEIYGSDWEIQLADDLGVEKHLVQAWASHQRAVPTRVIAELPELLCIKAAELREKADDLCSLSAQLIADRAPARGRLSISSR